MITQPRFSYEQYAEEALRRMVDAANLLVDLQYQHPEIERELGEVCETLLPEHDDYWGLSAENAEKASEILDAFIATQSTA